MKPKADALILAIRARGSDTTNLRDAAHEAHHHALSAGVRGKWTRVNIDVPFSVEDARGRSATR